MTQTSNNKITAFLANIGQVSALVVLMLTDFIMCFTIYSIIKIIVTTREAFAAPLVAGGF